MDAGPSEHLDRQCGLGLTLVAYALALLGLSLVLLLPSNAAAASASYLALGDSVPFGYSPNISPYQPAAMTSYADVAARSLGLILNNPSCSGETTQHYLGLPAAPDNGCGLYRLFFPLHVGYFGSQADFASGWLASNAATTSLVTVQLGSNNYWLLQSGCWGYQPCIDAGMPAVQARVMNDLNAIVGRLRASGYQKRIVLVNYHSTGSYSSPIAADMERLDAAIQASASANGLPVADAFSAFRTASPNGDPCAAGLLVRKSDGTCDVHPSLAGHSIIASLITALAG